MSSGRARLFEVIQRVKEVNAQRQRNTPGRQFTSASSHDPEVRRNPSLALDYIVAPPRMAHYIDWSTRVYSVYLKHADAVFIGGDMLRANVHGDLGQIQIRPNARRSGDTGRLQNVEDDFPGKFTGRQMVGLQVAGGVDEHLIDAVWVDVLRSSQAV